MQVFFSIHRDQASTEVAGVRYLSVTFPSTQVPKARYPFVAPLHMVVLQCDILFALLSVKTIQFLAI